MNWLRAIEEANTLEYLLEVVADYLHERPRDFWNSIPADAQPASVDSEADLHKWHQELVQRLTRMKNPGLNFQDLCVFFLRASIRAHQIGLKDKASGPTNDTSFSAMGRNTRRA